jgi:hypothetical protein
MEEKNNDGKFRKLLQNQDLKTDDSHAYNLKLEISSDQLSPKAILSS